MHKTFYRQANVEVGTAGSLTIAILIIAVVFLLRSFYKRYMGIDRSDDRTEQ
jgi:ABC-type sugar transport system permease subunit